MTRLTDPLSGRRYVLEDGELRQVSPFPVDHGAVQRLVLAHLEDGRLEPTIHAALAHKQTIQRLNEMLRAVA